MSLTTVYVCAHIGCGDSFISCKGSGGFLKEYGKGFPPLRVEGGTGSVETRLKTVVSNRNEQNLKT